MPIELLIALLLVGGILLVTGKIKIPHFRKATPAGTTTVKTSVSEKLLTASNLALLGFIVLVAAYVAGTSLDMGQLAKWIALAFGMFLLVRLITPGPWAIIAAATLLIIFGWLGAERSEVVVKAVNKIPDTFVNAIDGKAGPSTIDVLCQDEKGRALPNCEIVTITDVGFDVFAPPYHCPHINPGGTTNYAPSSKGVGWWTFTSKSGKPVTVGLYKPRSGQTFFKKTCT